MVKGRQSGKTEGKDVHKSLKCQVSSKSQVFRASLVSIQVSRNHCWQVASRVSSCYPHLTVWGVRSHYIMVSPYNVIESMTSVITKLTLSPIVLKILLSNSRYLLFILQL